MKNLKEYIIKENNFFKNLGVGTKFQTQKWVEENERYLRTYHDVQVDEDGGLVITMNETAYLFFVPNKLVVPSYVRLSKVIQNGSACGSISLNNLSFDDFEYFIGGVEVINNTSFKRIPNGITFVECDITDKDVSSVPECFEEIVLRECPNIKGSINIKTNANYFHIFNCNINKIKFSYTGNVLGAFILDRTNISSINNIVVDNGSDKINFLDLKNSPLTDVINKEIEELTGIPMSNIGNERKLKKINKILSDNKIKTLEELKNKFKNVWVIKLNKDKWVYDFNMKNGGMNIIDRVSK